LIAVAIHTILMVPVLVAALPYPALLAQALMQAHNQIAVCRYCLYMFYHWPHLTARLQDFG
jgi:hypothetical protein